jgi:transcription initiation factor IIE alpha subunit
MVWSKTDFLDMDVSEQEHEYDAVDGSFLNVLSQETVDDNHNQKQPDVFQCSICDMKYAHKSSLKRHMNKHSNEPSFTCGICHQYFTTEEQLQSHRTKYHGNRYLCNDWKRL